MSIYTDMIPAMLQVNEGERGLTGALKYNWIDVKPIDVAIYKNDSFKSVQNEKYQTSTHNGLTFFRDFTNGKEYRLLIGQTPMEITDVNTSGRISTLLLKEISHYER